MKCTDIKADIKERYQQRICLYLRKSTLLKHSLVITPTIQQHINVSLGSGSTQVSGTSSSVSSSTTGGASQLPPCTPFSCPSIMHDNLPNPKAGIHPSLHIGILQTQANYNPNSVNLAKFAAYQLNNYDDVQASIEIYSQISIGPVSMDAATVALFGIANITALLVESDEDGTLSIAQLGSAYQAPVISLSSITEAFVRRINYPSLMRMTPQMRYGTEAIIEILQYLNKTTAIYIYSTDTYGNSAGLDFINQASLQNISVFSVGVPTSGNIDSALQMITAAVGVNWNVFIMAITNLQQASRVLRFMSQTNLIGRNYLQILSPNFEKLFANGAASNLLPYISGALAVMPRIVDTGTDTFQYFQFAWGGANSSVFPGARPYPANGYMAYDAVFAIANTVSNIMNAGNPYPGVASASFVAAMKNTSFEGLSGQVSFDANGDREGDYVIYNHIGNESVPVGVYWGRTSSFERSQPFVYYNGTYKVPVLLNITTNLTYYCSYSPTSSITTTTTGPTGGTTPPPENSSSHSSEDSSSYFYVGPDSGPPPTISGTPDPNNLTKCICFKGYDGDRCDKLVKYRDSIPAISIALGAITLIAALLALFAAVMLGLYWENFKKHGSFYCAVIIVGVFFSYISVLMLLPVQSDALCMLFPWFLGIGFTLVYGCLFVKTWTLYQVYRSAEQLKKTSLTPLSVIKGIGAYLAIEILILVIWTCVDRPIASYHRMDDGTFLKMCNAKHATFWGIFAGTKSLWLLFGVVLSFLTRNVTEEYSESKSIAYATYNIMVLLVIGIPMAIALRNVAGGLVIIEAGVILIAFTFTMCSLFLGIWIRIFSNEKIILPALHSGSRRGSSQTKSSSQKSSGSRESPRSHSRSGTEPSHSSVEMVVRI